MFWPEKMMRPLLRAVSGEVVNQPRELPTMLCSNCKKEDVMGENFKSYTLGSINGRHMGRYSSVFATSPLDLFSLVMTLILTLPSFPTLGQVILYEQDWNPQVDKQALQRAHIIGQMNHVFSINLVTERTGEEVSLNSAERKLQLSYDVMGENTIDKESKDMAGIAAGDLRSVVLGLRMFDPTTETEENSDQLEMSKVNAIVEKVISFRHGGRSLSGRI